MVQNVREPPEEWILREILEDGILPLDERFRKAQQFELDLEPPRPEPVQVARHVCIGNCAICPYCEA